MPTAPNAHRPDPAPPRSARGRQARDAILSAATADLAQHGEIEVARVAARAGVSDGLPYRYFGNRSGLVAAVVEAFHLRLAEAVVYRDIPGATWQEREEVRVREWVATLYADPVAPALLGGIGGDALVAASWQRRLDLAVEVGARNIAKGQRDGDLPRGNDPTLLAATVLGGVQSAVAVALASDPRPSARKVASNLWRFVQGAAEAAPPARERRTR